MASRRILSNSNLAPVQEAAVNPYSAFNSNNINKLTRIVSGGKDIDVIVDGLDTLSNDLETWTDSANILRVFNDAESFISKGWTGKNYYVLNKDGQCCVDLELPHEKNYGFSYIECKLDDDKLLYYYQQNKERDFEITFTLNMGTPKLMVAYINKSKVEIDHPDGGSKVYSVKINRNFVKDTKEQGLTFRIGAVLDAADPECIMQHDSKKNSTYIRISNIELKICGYTRHQWPRALGPINGVYGLSGIHPLKTLKVTPGLCIKDDAMIEELGISKIDKNKIVELDFRDPTSWINGKIYNKEDFIPTGTSKIQYAYQLNNTATGYIRRRAHFDDNGHLKVSIGSMDVDPTDDEALCYNDTQLKDSKLDFNEFVEDTDNNVTFKYHNSTSFKITNNSNICLVVYIDKSGKKRVVGKTTVECEADGTLKDFEVTVDSSRITGRIESITQFEGYISTGPIKISGDPQLYEEESVRWAYAVVYYSYFVNPQPNVSYVGLVRAEDINDVRYREDYLILAKLRFIDPYTVDIISYEDRQRKVLPRSDKVNYSSTCNYPEIWYEAVPDTVTDALDYLAKFDVNLARLITYKHDYDAEISTAFNLAKSNTKNTDGGQAPFISVNTNNHLERRIRIDTNNLDVTVVYIPGMGIPSAGTRFVYDAANKVYKFGDWAITFDQDVIDNTLNSESELLGNEVCVKAAMGPYDSVTKTLTNRYICFNSIGPFKFLDHDTGNLAVKVDWVYDNDILLYPTAPSLLKSGGNYTDTDDGGYSDGFYKEKKSAYSAKYMLSYTSAEGSIETSMNSDKNHFKYIKFRNDFFLSDRLVKLLDILPRKVNSEVNESLIHKRVLEGQKNQYVENDQVHIESSIHQLDDDMVDENLLISQRDNAGTNHIKSSKFTIDPNLIDDCVLTSEDITESGKPERIKIKSTNVKFDPSGENKILVSNEIPGTNIYEITSSDYTPADFIGYWFKPMISYYSTDNSVRLIMDCSKNFIVRISEILKKFDIIDKEENTVNITSVEKLEDKRTRYYYQPTTPYNPKTGMFVYTSDSEKATKVVQNTIPSTLNFFSKITNNTVSSTGYITSNVVTYPSEFSPYDHNYDLTSDFQMTIMPTQDSSFYSAITKITRIGSTNQYKIYYGYYTDSDTFMWLNGYTCIDDFVVKPGMRVYTSGLVNESSSGKTTDHNIYRYNYITIDSVGSDSDGSYIVITADYEMTQRAFGYTPEDSRDHTRLYYINTSDSVGLYPMANVKSATYDSTTDTTTINFYNNGEDGHTQKYVTTSTIDQSCTVYSSERVGSNPIIKESDNVSIKEINFFKNESDEDTKYISSIIVNGNYSALTSNESIYFKAEISGIFTNECMFSKIGANIAKCTVASNSNMATFIIGNEADAKEYRLVSKDIYSKWTSTNDYVGYYLKFVDYYLQVTTTNKDLLGIVVGTTKPYTQQDTTSTRADKFPNHLIPGIISPSNLYCYTKGEIYRTLESGETQNVSELYFDQNNTKPVLDYTNLTEEEAVALGLTTKKYDEDGKVTTCIYYSTFVVELDSNLDTAVNFTQNIALRSQESSFVAISMLYKYKVNRVGVDNTNNIASYVGNSTSGVNIEPDCMFLTTEDSGMTWSNTIPSNIPLEITEVGNDSKGSYFNVIKTDSFDTNDVDFTATSKFITMADIIANNSDNNTAFMKIRVDVDVTNLQKSPDYDFTKDDYKAIDRYYQGKIVVINDLDTNFDKDEGSGSYIGTAWKKYCTLSFAVLQDYTELDDSTSEDPDIKANENPTRIIWKDEYRGYNRSFDSENNTSYMDLYPVNVSVKSKDGKVKSTAAITSEYSSGATTIAQRSGYGACRGPIYNLFAGVQSEFSFKYVKTIPNLPEIQTEEYKATNLQFRQLRDVVYAQSHMYYINNTEKSDEDVNQLTVTYYRGALSFPSSSDVSKKQIINDPTITSTYIFPEGCNDMVKGLYYKGYKWGYESESNEVHDGDIILSQTNHALTCYAISKVITVEYYTLKDGYKEADPNLEPHKYTLFESRQLTIVTPSKKDNSNWTTINNPLSKTVDSSGIIKPNFPTPNPPVGGLSLNGWTYKDLSQAQLTDTVSKFWLTYVEQSGDTGTLKLYSSWSDNGITVTLNPNGGTFDDGSSSNRDIFYNSYNEPYGSLPRNLTKSGSEFLGWYYGDTEIKDTTVISTVCLTSHTLVAKWKASVLVAAFDPHLPQYTGEVPTKHLVKQTFSYNTIVSQSEYDGRFGPYSDFATGNLPSLVDCIDGETTYKFNGWYFEPTLQNRITNESIVTALYSHVLYAKWQIDKPIKLTCDYRVFGEGAKSVVASYNGTSKTLTPENNCIELRPGTIVTVSTSEDVDKIFFLNAAESGTLYHNNYSFITETEDIKLTCIKINDHGTYSYNGYAHTKITDFVHNGSLIGGFKYIFHYYDDSKWNTTGTFSTGWTTTNTSYEYNDADFYTDSFGSVAHKDNNAAHQMHVGLVYQDTSVHIKDMYQTSSTDYPYYIDKDGNHRTSVPKSSSTTASVDIKDTTLGGNGILTTYIKQNNYLSVYFNNVEFDFTDKEYTYEFQPGFTLQDHGEGCTGVKCDISYILKIEGEDKALTTYLMDDDQTIVTKDNEGRIIS